MRTSNLHPSPSNFWRHSLSHRMCSNIPYPTYPDSLTVKETDILYLSAQKIHPMSAAC